MYKLFKYAGPGLLISVAYLDPGNLESDLQVGALTNYKVPYLFFHGILFVWLKYSYSMQLLWVLLYSAIAGFFIQFLSVKLGSATGSYHSS